MLVVDSGEFVENKRETCEALFEVLVNSDIQKARCPVLVLCNKQDYEMARGAGAILATLESEVRICFTKQPTDRVGRY